MPTPTLVLNQKQISQRINRIAYEIYENNPDETEILIAGIASNGFILAKKIGETLEKISPIKPRYCELKVNKRNPLDNETIVCFTKEEAEGKSVVVVDDVLNSGRTLIHGIKPFLNFNPKRLNTVVLVDRNHNRYPVKADFVGLSLATTLKEHIRVEFEGEEAVYLE